MVLLAQHGLSSAFFALILPKSFNCRAINAPNADEQNIEYLIDEESQNFRERKLRERGREAQR